MKIATWNVNSLRARYERMVDFLQYSDVDVLLIQETKCKDDNFPEFDIRTLGYDVAHLGLSQFNGVSIMSKKELSNTVFGMQNQSDPYINDARILKTEIDGIVFVSVYAPNGRDIDSEHYDMKLNWYDHFIEYVKLLKDRHSNIVLGGDFNIAPRDIDVFDVSEFPLTTHITEKERDKYFKLLELGFTDAYVHKYPNEATFTFWDYRGGDFHRNRGMRIDYFLVSDPIKSKIEDIYVDRETRKGKKPSDHAALVMELED